MRSAKLGNHLKSNTVQFHGVKEPYKSHNSVPRTFLSWNGSIIITIVNKISRKQHIKISHQYGFLSSFLSRQFAGKPLVVLRNVSCFQRLGYLFVSEVKQGQVKITH